MTPYREGLPPLPPRLAHLPLDERGYPVPWFVPFVNGVPDFRCMDSDKLVRAVREDLCWTCGRANGAHKVFAIGPMCVVNRVTAEPPSHMECVEYSAKACPFLSEPKRRRRAPGMPVGVLDPVGEMILRNPGVTCLWSTKKFELKRVDHGVMFMLGEPTKVTWWCRSRPATRDEVLESLDGGLPLLLEACEKDDDPAESRVDVAKWYRRSLKFLPSEHA